MVTDKIATTTPKAQRKLENMKTSIILGLLSIACAVAGEEFGATEVWIVDRKADAEPL
jgi:hypothetical protein